MEERGMRRKQEEEGMGGKEKCGKGMRRGRSEGKEWGEGVSGESGRGWSTDTSSCFPATSTCSCPTFLSMSSFSECTCASSSFRTLASCLVLSVFVSATSYCSNSTIVLRPNSWELVFSRSSLCCVCMCACVCACVCVCVCVTSTWCKYTIDRETSKIICDINFIQWFYNVVRIHILLMFAVPY